MDQLGAPLENGIVIELDPTTNNTINIPGLGSEGTGPAQNWIVTGDGVPPNTRIAQGTNDYPYPVNIVNGKWQIRLTNAVTSVNGATITFSIYLGTAVDDNGINRTIGYYIT